MNSSFNKSIKGRARSGMSVIRNQVPILGIIDVGTICMQMNDKFHNAARTYQASKLSPINP